MISAKLNHDTAELIESKFLKIKKVFDENKIDQPKDEHYRVRPSLVNNRKIFKNYGHLNKFVYEEASSGEESDIENEKTNMPKVAEVASAVVDPATFLALKDVRDFPREAEPSLLFSNLDDWATPLIVKRFVEETPCIRQQEVKIESIKLIKYKEKSFALVTFQKLFDCELLFNYFNNPFKRRYSPAKNSLETEIRVYYCFDLTQLTFSYWYAVVLRKLPPNSTSEKVKSFSANHTANVQYATQPCMVKGFCCSVVVLDTLDDAEQLCKKLNKNDKVLSKGRVIKVNLHPNCCKVRRNPERSHFREILTKGRIEFPDYMLQGKELVESGKCTSLTKLAEGIIKKDRNRLKKLHPKEEKGNTTAETEKSKTPPKETPTAPEPLSQVTQKSSQSSFFESRLNSLVPSLPKEAKKKQKAEIAQNTEAKPNSILSNIGSILELMANKEKGKDAVKSSPPERQKAEENVVSLVEEPEESLEESEIESLVGIPPQLDAREAEYYVYNMTDKVYFDKPPKKKQTWPLRSARSDDSSQHRQSYKGSDSLRRYSDYSRRRNRHNSFHREREGSRGAAINKPIQKVKHIAPNYKETRHLGREREPRRDNQIYERQPRRVYSPRRSSTHRHQHEYVKRKRHRSPSREEWRKNSRRSRDRSEEGGLYQRRFQERQHTERSPRYDRPRHRGSRQ